MNAANIQVLDANFEKQFVFRNAYNLFHKKIIVPNSGSYFITAEKKYSNRVENKNVQ